MYMLLAIPLGLIFGTIQTVAEKPSSTLDLLYNYMIGFLMAAWGCIILFYILPKFLW